MTERVGRHAARDPGETLVLQAISPDDEPPYVPPSTGRHASGRSEDAGPDAQPADSRPEVPPQPEVTPLPEPVALTEPSPNGRGSRNGSPPPDLPSYAEPPPPAAEPAPQLAGPGSPAGGPLRLVWVYPDLLSTYGDRGNLLVLMRRARLRGLDVAPTEVKSDEPVPADGDIYLLGGGEDLPQILAAARLRSDGGLQRAAKRGAVIFAVCAGYQLIGRQFGGVDGEPVEGLGILDVTSGRGDRRGVGEIVADVDPALGVPRLTGFENHQGVTQIGPGARPLARVALGVGNGDGTEGAYAGRVLGTYLHGPALARNPGLADLLLSWAAGPLQTLDPATEDWARRLREERLAATSS
jgi:CobQ-like glutamine amidotransferase family enzyme